jgi:iron complex transport system substrate-binding protein
MVKIRLAALVALLVLLTAPAFALGGARGVSAVSYPVSVQAANGAVVIQARPTRIVSLSPSATEDLFAIGAGSQVVAVDDQSNYPASVPRTDLWGYTPNAEAVAGYKPDLVVVSSDGGIVAALNKLGITVLLEPAAKNLGEAYGEIAQLGTATDHEPQAASVVHGMQRQLTKLIRSVPKRLRHLKVFHELSPDFYSATSSTFIGQLYKLFGFRNIADAADPTHAGYPKLSAEYILNANPDLVVLSDTKCCKQSAETAAARTGWQHLSAVKHGRVIGVSDDIASRWGPRIVAFARVVAHAAMRS